LRADEACAAALIFVHLPPFILQNDGGYVNIDLRFQGRFFLPVKIKSSVRDGMARAIDGNLYDEMPKDRLSWDKIVKKACLGRMEGKSGLGF